MKFRSELFMQEAKAYMIVDLQFGSTGKGLLAGYLAEKYKPDVVATAWGANAGHTYINKDGRKWVHTALANGIVSPRLEYVLIGPGSQLNVTRLRQEIAEAGFDHRKVKIHPHAAIITERHLTESAGRHELGSTKKGSGPCHRDKALRPRDHRIVAAHFVPGWCSWSTGGHGATAMLQQQQQGIPYVLGSEDLDFIAEHIVSVDGYAAILDKASLIQIEGAQGYSLGINSGFYPFTTYRECTPAQILCDTGIPIKMLGFTYGVARTLPIRVANRFDSLGQMIGWSGPGYSDQDELEWDALGIDQEYTTVTGLPRRIFSFSKMQTYAALRDVRPDLVFLNFANYVSIDRLKRLVGIIDSAARSLDYDPDSSIVGLIGWGPKSTDIEVL